MNIQEVGKLLATCAAFDRRTVGDGDIIAWRHVLGDLDYAECETAVLTHYSDSREWIMPADIRTRVKRGRRETAERERAAILLDPERYRAVIAAQDSAFLRKLAAKGLTAPGIPVAEIESGRTAP